MRRLATTTTLLLLSLLPLASTPARHAARAAQRCPLVEVTCPNVAGPGEEAVFTAFVDAAAADVKYTYKWEVSAGTIAGGQGTPSIKVDTTGVFAPITGTVEVGGLPASCERRVSCSTAHIDGPRCMGPLDAYGDITSEDEQARLDNFAIELQNDPTATAYILCYGGRVGYEGEAQRRCDRARDYVSNVRGIDADRIVTADGGFKENLTVVLWLVPSGATLPEATPTVNPADVTILKRKDARKPRRR